MASGAVSKTNDGTVCSGLNASPLSAATQASLYDKAGTSIIYDIVNIQDIASQSLAALARSKQGFDRPEHFRFSILSETEVSGENITTPNDIRESNSTRDGLTPPLVHSPTTPEFFQISTPIPEDNVKFPKLLDEIDPDSAHISTTPPDAVARPRKSPPDTSAQVGSSSPKFPFKYVRRGSSTSATPSKVTKHRVKAAHTSSQTRRTSQEDVLARAYGLFPDPATQPSQLTSVTHAEPKILVTPKSVQNVVALPGTTIKPPKLKTKFYAIDLNENRKTWTPNSDLSRMRDGSTFRPHLTPKTNENEGRRRHRLTKAAQRAESPQVDNANSSTSTFATRKAAQTAIGKIVTNAIKDAHARGSPIARSATRQTRGEGINKRRKVYIQPPRKPKGIFPQAEAQARAAQWRMKQHNACTTA